jgi:hypothetical protein
MRFACPRYRGKSFFYLVSASRLRAKARAPKTEELKIYIFRFACPRYRVAAIAARAFFLTLSASRLRSRAGGPAPLPPPGTKKKLYLRYNFFFVLPFLSVFR